MENSYVMHSSHLSNLKTVGHFVNSTMDDEESMLSLVIVVGSSVSLVGLIFAFLTYSLFSDLRNMSGTMIMNLIATVFMSQLIYVTGVGGTQDMDICASLAFCLEYFNACGYCWTLALTDNMYNSFRYDANCIPCIPQRKMVPSFVKSSLFAWLTPLALLAYSYFLHTVFTSFDANEIHKMNYCWLLEKKVYIYGYAIPIALVLAALVYRLYCTWTVITNSMTLHHNRKLKEKVKRSRGLQFNLQLKISIILTISFICSSFAHLTTNKTAWYLFNLQNSLQGLIIALILTCSCQVIKIYARSMKRKNKIDRSYYDGYQFSSSEFENTDDIAMANDHGSQLQLTSV